MFNINGYNWINIYLENGKQYNLSEHKLNALINNPLKEVFNPDNHVHHWNHCKIDNRCENLVVMPKGIHTYLHNRGKTHSLETRKKLSEINKGKNLSDEHRKKISEAKKGNKNRFNPCLKIRKVKNKNYKQGFRWVSRPHVNGKEIKLSSVNLETCIKRVKEFINSEENTLGYDSYEIKI